MADLNILFPEPEKLRVGGRDVTIKAVQLRHFELFGKAASELLQVVAAGSVEQIHAYGARNSQELRSVLLATTKLSPFGIVDCWLVRRLPVTVCIQLLLQVIRANASFFGQAQAAAAKTLDGLH